ncbi:Scr1 family TA system antitoxin-like transcriptional regulator [Streptomyces althioticus]|uniref:Scr1 family TA system antitoxin-like transcriptional regulator n=1 Tax=Streptomyces althioticus TaxID=83380 RepID=UPI0037AEE68C
MILDEAVLRRPIGGAAVTRKRLRRSLDAAEECRLSVRVLPLDQGGHEAMGGSLTLCFEGACWVAFMGDLKSRRP